MPKRPTVNVKKISRKTVKGYGYVRPNPGVRAIAAINGKGSYSARAQMSGLSPAQRRSRAKRAVKKATSKRSGTMPRRRISKNARYARPRSYAGRTSVSFTVKKARGKGTRRISFRAPSGHQQGDKYTVMASNRRRRKPTRRRRSVARRPRTASGRFKSTGSRRRVRRNYAAAPRARVRRRPRRRPAARARVGYKKKVRRSAPRRRVVANRRSPVRRRRSVARRRAPVRRRRVSATRRRAPVRRRRVSATRRKRRVVRNARRRAPVRRRRRSSRRVVRNKRRRSIFGRRRAASRRRAPVRRRRALARNARRRAPRRRGLIRRRYRRNQGPIMQWLQTGSFIAVGLIGHKFLTGFLKNILVAKAPVVSAEPVVDAQVDGSAPASGLGILPPAMVPYAGIISGGLAAFAGVYLVNMTVKNQNNRMLISGGIVASFVHTIIIDMLRNFAPGLAQQVSGLGASDANAARLSAMYGVGGNGTSIEPMYADINGMGEYFASGVSGLGALPSYAAQAGTGEYFGSGVGEYFSSGVSGLGEYGANPDMAQAAAGYGALDAGSNSNHLDPSSNLDRELSIAEAAAGVGNLGPMQAAAGLGNVGIVGASQTWIPGESDPQIWAGVRPVDRSQMATAMVPAGSLQSGGGQGVFG